MSQAGEVVRVQRKNVQCLKSNVLAYWGLVVKMCGFSSCVSTYDNITELTV